MSSSAMWSRVKTGSKSGFDKAWKAMDKLGAPVNNLSNKLGSEAFWPTTLDKESDKAARILKSFCKDGFYAEEDTSEQGGPKQKQKVFKKIPTKVIQNAKGLAIFTTMRTGLWVSGAGGSGVLIARKEDGTWSPPSGILLHTAGLGFLVGVDIYDCVVVINTESALEAFTKVRCTLGSEVSVAAGPVGAGGVLETELHKRQAPIFTYLKSRGFYAGVQIDGTIIIERTDENERFYNQRIPVKDILAGKVRHPPYEVRRLLETIKAAQGDSDVDETILPTEAPPSDFEIDHGHIFGVPDKEDPDPYGVLALEKEGMSIKEAGTQKRASWETFNFNPAPSSPIHDIVRHSREASLTGTRRSSWRTSAFGNNPSSIRNSMERPRSVTAMTDSATQTDVSDEPVSPEVRSTYSPRSSRASLAAGSSMQDLPEYEVLETTRTVTVTQPDQHPTTSQVNGYTTPPHTPPPLPHREPIPTLTTCASAAESDLDLEHEHNDEDVHLDEPAVVVQSVQAAAPQLISKARIVTVPKRIPPKLPPRNPNRALGNTAPVTMGPTVVDASTTTSNASAADDEAVTTIVSPTREDAVPPSPIAEAVSKHDSGHENTAALTSEPQKEEEEDAAMPIEAKFDEIHLEDHDANTPVADEAEVVPKDEKSVIQDLPEKSEEKEIQTEHPETSSADVKLQHQPGESAAMPGGW